MRQVQIFLFLIVFVFTLVISPPAHAVVCRDVNGHHICILNIKRSAKKYWEYRVTASIDGINQPSKTYQCRDRIKFLPNGTILRFGDEDVAQVVCNLFKRY